MLVLSPADFGRLISDETGKWRKVIRPNIKAEQCSVTPAPRMAAITAAGMNVNVSSRVGVPWYAHELKGRAA